jgi:hypothetical protein
MIGTHKTTIGRHGNWLDVRYHSTDVASRHDDGRIVLRTGGWRTVTTKKRMNQALEVFGSPYRVYQRKGEWFVSTGTENMQYSFDGDILELPA